MKTQNNDNLRSRLLETKFNYLSIDCWSTLFYQIIKIYYLAKVNVKSLKSFPGLSTE